MNLDVVYPLQTLKPIASQLRSRVQSDGGDDDVTWREKMERAILDIPQTSQHFFENRPVNGAVDPSWEGDVVPVQINEGVEVRVEDNAMFVAEMGEGRPGRRQSHKADLGDTGVK